MVEVERGIGHNEAIRCPKKATEGNCRPFCWDILGFKPKKYEREFLED
jgi:hypothetical protein